MKFSLDGRSELPPNRYMLCVSLCACMIGLDLFYCFVQMLKIFNLGPSLQIPRKIAGLKITTKVAELTGKPHRAIQESKKRQKIKRGNVLLRVTHERFLGEQWSFQSPHQLRESRSPVKR